MRCPKCNNTLEITDAKKVGGLPGVKYRYCNNCGYSRAITKRQKKERSS